MFEKLNNFSVVVIFQFIYIWLCFVLFEKGKIYFNSKEASTENNYIFCGAPDVLFELFCLQY